MENRFEIKYKKGNLPWNIERPDYNLVNTVEGEPIPVGTVLDVGCGTGDNALWLAKNGFKVTGIDYSRTAIEMATSKSSEARVGVNFLTLDILKDKIPGGPFSFVFDRGCFHSFDTKAERKIYSKNVSSLLMPGGLWLSLIGNFDDGRLDVGPPKRSAEEIAAGVEPYFEIQYLKAGRFDSNDSIPSKIWIGLMKKRKLLTFS